MLNKLTELMAKYGYKPYANKKYWTIQSINFINKVDFKIIIYLEKITFKIEIPHSYQFRYWIENNKTPHINIKMVYEIYNILKEGE